MISHISLAVGLLGGVLAFAHSATPRPSDGFELLGRGLHVSPILSESVEALGLKSDLVIVGRVTSASEGRVIGEVGGHGGLPTVVLKVVVEETLKGKAPEKTIYVEQFVGRGMAQLLPGAFRDGNARTLMFLETDEWFALKPATPVLNEGRGRPAGKPVFRISSVQGLLAESDDGSVNLPLAAPEDWNVFPADAGFDAAVDLARTEVSGQLGRPGAPVHGPQYNDFVEQLEGSKGPPSREWFEAQGIAVPSDAI